MKRLFSVIAAWSLLTASAWAAINFASGAHNATIGTNTITATYSPTAVSVITLWLVNAATASGMACADNNSHALTAGPTITNVLILTGFYGTTIAGATSYTCTWTTSGAASITLEEYSGVSSVNASLSGNTNSGTSGTATITATTQDNNDWFVCGLMASNQTLTVTVGNSRQPVTTGGLRQVLADNTVATAGSLTCTATLTSAAWAAAVIELRVAAGGTIRRRAEVIQR